MKHSESVSAIAPAYVLAQSCIEGAIKDKRNSHFGQSYADLSAVIDACRSQLAANDLAIMQTTDCAEDLSYVIIETTLIHKSGEWYSSELKMPLEKRSAQAVGSAMTYGRRYALAAMMGIAQVDDDAEASMNRGQNGNQQTARKQQTQQKDEVSKITDEQVQKISELIPKAKLTEAAFLKHYELNSIADMPADWYEAAMKALHNRISEVQKKAQQQEQKAA